MPAFRAAPVVKRTTLLQNLRTIRLHVQSSELSSYAQGMRANTFPRTKFRVTPLTYSVTSTLGLTHQATCV